jgi:5-methylcytosine-specific restriction endonuclease McrA
LAKVPGTQADAILMKCRRALARHRQAAAKDGARLDYSLEDLLGLAKCSPLCCYCRTPLSFAFEFDHMTPIARTARAHQLTNLCCACGPCNRAKGLMDADEYRRFLDLLNTFDYRARTYTLAMLRLGPEALAKCKKRSKSPQLNDLA